MPKALRILLKTLLGLVLLLVVGVGAAILLVPGIHSSSILMILNVMTGRAADTPEDALLARLKVPEGYAISIFARGIANPRFLHRTAGGHVLVSSPRSDEIVQLTDSDGDGFADQQAPLLSDLKRPHGIDIHGGYLYVAESSQVGRVPYDEATGKLLGDYEVIIAGLTDNGNHWTKSIRFSPEGDLYLSLGSTCNVCEEADERRATIMRFAADGSDGEIFARGLRNTVGLDFAPWDGSLYATDNGRDLLGDDYPPCELNQVVEGAHYGWPYINGYGDPDPDFGDRAGDIEATDPAFPFPAHNAPLGIYFPQGEQRRALVALHGSWNRSIPDGYKVVALDWSAEGEISSSDFMWGFEEDADIVGRPVDITADGAGGFFISDDYARVIYRVSLGEAPVQTTAASGSEVAVETDMGLAQLDPALVEQGASLYRKYPCASCHSPNAMTPIPLDQLAGKYTLESLQEYFLTPTPPMPNFQLKKEERRALAHYLFSRQ